MCIYISTKYTAGVVIIKNLLLFNSISEKIKTNIAYVKNRDKQQKKI